MSLSYSSGKRTYPWQISSFLVITINMVDIPWLCFTGGVSEAVLFWFHHAKMICLNFLYTKQHGTHHDGWDKIYSFNYCNLLVTAELSCEAPCTLVNMMLLMIVTKLRMKRSYLVKFHINHSTCHNMITALSIQTLRVHSIQNSMTEGQHMVILT